jgi:CheY-like chemotaxis protein
MEAGCDDFLPKPIRTEDLLIRLEKYLKLTWIYEETSDTDEKNDEAGSKLETDVLVGPSKEQATVLFDLAMKGNLKGVVKQLDKFEQLDPKLTIFANQVRALADDFDEEQICDLIEQYLK